METKREAPPPEREPVLQDCYDLLDECVSLTLEVSAAVKTIENMLDEDFIDLPPVKSTVREVPPRNFRFGMTGLAKEVNRELQSILADLDVIRAKLVFVDPKQ